MTKLRDRLIRLAYKGGPAMMRLALFGGIADSGEAAASEARRRPDLRYLIFFTARSGSSHLSSLIGALPQEAKPGESFNPYLMRGPLAKLGSRDIETYARRLIRQPRYASGFGAKVIAPHLQVLFGAPERLFELVEPTH